MGNNNNHLDTRYDDAFEQSGMYPWLPWVGMDFFQSHEKTVILGESTYNWSTFPEDRERTQERISKNDHLRVLHQNHALNQLSNAKFVRNIERAIFQKKRPEWVGVEKIWRNVVYHNLVLRAMPSLKDRPNYNDYKEGWLAFIELAKELSIDQCIVYGLEHAKLESLFDVLKASNIDYSYLKIKPSIGRSYPKVVEITLNDMTIKMLFVRHPSAFFSWKKWGRVINSELDMSGIFAAE